MDVFFIIIGIVTIVWVVKAIVKKDGAGTRYTESSGSSASSATAKCPNCQNTDIDGDAFCPNCGQSLR